MRVFSVIRIVAFCQIFAWNFRFSFVIWKGHLVASVQPAKAEWNEMMIRFRLAFLTSALA